jgi:hypothetical protein
MERYNLDVIYRWTGISFVHLLTSASKVLTGEDKMSNYVLTCILSLPTK